MADFRRLLYVFAAVAFLMSLTVPAYAQFTCFNFNAVPVPARAEGFTELVGDITFNCSANGQPSTTPGSTVPSVNITVTANTNITSRILAVSTVGLKPSYNEALLLIDEPNTTKWIPISGGRPITNCGVENNDIGPDGPGVCSIIAPTNPNLTYDGTVGSKSNGATDFVACSGFGCGRPNVFQGRQAVSLISGQPNAIEFLEVPFDPPATNTSRSIRITNIRMDATRFGSANPFSVVPMTATVSFGGGTTISVANTTVTVANAQSGMTSKVRAGDGFLQCVGTDQDLPTGLTDSGFTSPSSPFFGGNPDTMRIRVAETFATSWRVRNLSGLEANGFIDSGGLLQWNGGGGVNPGVDFAQNIPGGVYNTESGFEFNAGTPVPVPNPPAGFGNGTVPNVGNPLNDFQGTNIQAAGQATQGTRIAVQVSTPLPNGALLFFPIRVVIRNQSTGNPTGVMVATAADTNGFGPYVRQTPTPFSFVPSGGGPAVTPVNNNFVLVTAALPVITYEVLFSQAGAQEYADIFPQVVFNNNGLPTDLPQTGVTVTASASFAPICSGTGCNQPQQDGVVAGVTGGVTGFSTPRFTSGFKSPGDALFTINKCSCNLLFPWVVSSGTIDTGIVIANTSLDPGGLATPVAGFGAATPQTGAVTFYYFGTTGIGDHNPVATLAPNTSLPVPAGGYVAHVLSQNTSATNGLAARTNFAGYVIAQANFQWCHGVVDITLGSTPIFNYVGLVLDEHVLLRTGLPGETLGH